MIEGNFIIDPIAHAYNLTDDNLQPNPYGRGLRDLLVKLHVVWNPPELQVPAEVYMTDWPMEVLARTLFLETDIDMACNMYLRLDFVVPRRTLLAQEEFEAANSLAAAVHDLCRGQPDQGS